MGLWKRVVNTGAGPAARIDHEIQELTWDTSRSLRAWESNPRTSRQLVEQLGGRLCGPVWPGPGMRVRNVCDPEGNIIHLRESAA